jgi:hypothetical protein
MIMKKTISADVPADLAEALKNYAAGSGVSLSSLLAEILTVWGNEKGLLFGDWKNRPRKKGFLEEFFS